MMLKTSGSLFLGMCKIFNDVVFGIKDLVVGVVLNVYTWYKGLRSADRHVQIKFWLLSAIFFLTIFGYTLVKEVKDAVFVYIVGREYIWLAKILTIFMLAPLVFFYSYLVDRIRRYQLLYFYSVAFGSLGLLFAWLVGNAVYGLPNTDTSPWRIFGWLYYFFVESYSPFLVSVFWAFANSVSDPQFSKKNYSMMVAASKFAGVLASLAGVAMLGGHFIKLTDVVSYQVLMVCSSLVIFVIPIAVKVLITLVPGNMLHGYEAAYKFEKTRSNEEKKDAGSSVSLMSGLRMFMKYPYVLGIFSILFFHEVVANVLNYLKLGVAQEASSSVGEYGIFLFQVAGEVHFAGMVFSILGASFLVNRFGERICLILNPLLVGFFLFLYMAAWGSGSLGLKCFMFNVALVMIRALNYAFNYPLREALYIPTVKDVKFKSKSWIDSFGSKISKSAGSSFNGLVENFFCIGSVLFFSTYSVFFVAVVAMWTLSSYWLGNRYEKVIKNNEVIGADE
ncbi:MAG: Plastidic atp adp transporter [candidate division TM6 bacterium GW2011_GWF2_32_72]|nr:MAG: Plastidic atp adp transporter [candidate division TM6 bacterium GW2011_GWF2_32_72]